jgi:hypothetical protein
MFELRTFWLNMDSYHDVGKMLFSFLLNLRGHPMCFFNLNMLRKAAIDVNVAPASRSIGQHTLILRLPAMFLATSLTTFLSCASFTSPQEWRRLPVQYVL